MALAPQVNKASHCRKCKPEEFPTGDRQSEGHLGIRFGDGSNWAVRLDGKDVSKDCSEAKAGSDGFVVLYDRHSSGRFMFLCECTEKDGHIPAEHVEHGFVEIRPKLVSNSLSSHLQ